MTRRFPTDIQTVRDASRKLRRDPITKRRGPRPTTPYLPRPILSPVAAKLGKSRFTNEADAAHLTYTPGKDVVLEPSVKPAVLTKVQTGHLASGIVSLARVESTSVNNHAFMLPLAGLRLGIDLDILEGSQLKLFETLDIDFDDDISSEDASWNQQLAKAYLEALVGEHNPDTGQLADAPPIFVNITKLLHKFENALKTTRKATDPLVAIMRETECANMISFLLCAFRLNLIDLKDLKESQRKQLISLLGQYVKKHKPELLYAKAKEGLSVSVHELVIYSEAITARRLMITLESGTKLPEPLPETHLASFDTTLEIVALFCTTFSDELGDMGTEILADFVQMSRTPTQTLQGLLMLIKCGYTKAAQEIAEEHLQDCFVDMHQEAMERKSWAEDEDLEFDQSQVFSEDSPFETFVENDIVAFYAQNFPERFMDQFGKFLARIGLFDKDGAQTTYEALCGNTFLFDHLEAVDIERTLSLAITLLRHIHTPDDFRTVAAAYVTHYLNHPDARQAALNFVNKHYAKVIEDNTLGETVMGLAYGLVNTEEYTDEIDAPLTPDTPPLQLVPQSLDHHTHNPLAAEAPKRAQAPALLVEPDQSLYLENPVFHNLQHLGFKRGRVARLAKKALTSNSPMYIKLNALMYLSETRPHELDNMTLIDFIYDHIPDVFSGKIAPQALYKAVSSLDPSDTSICVHLKSIQQHLSKLIKEHAVHSADALALLAKIGQLLEEIPEPRPIIHDDSPYVSKGTGRSSSKPKEPRMSDEEKAARELANKLKLPRKKKKRFVREHQ